MAIEFKNAIQEKVHGNIQKWGRELYGETLRSFDDGSFGISFGSAYVYIVIYPWGDDECTILMYTPLIDEVDITADLTRYLLEENFKMPPFGGFSISTRKDGNEYICLEEHIVGSSATKDELRLTISQLGGMADDYDDEIRNKWGGRRWKDR